MTVRVDLRSLHAAISGSRAGGTEKQNRVSLEWYWSTRKGRTPADRTGAKPLALKRNGVLKIDGRLRAEGEGAEP
jgi:hypothetical protein